MKTLEIMTASHPHYRAAVAFVDDIYTHTLHVHARTPPDILIAAMEHGAVHGCIGFNHTVSWRFFDEDERYQNAIALFPPHIRIGEQNMFAIRNFPAGIPLLISALAAYAEKIGIQKIVFAGIGVSCRTISQLGHHVTILGPTKHAITDPADQESYQYWIEHFDPQTCILDTRQANHIYETVSRRFVHKACPEKNLREQLAA